MSRGDILLAIGAQETNSAQDVAAAVADLTAGDEVDLVVTHGDDERTLPVTAGEQNGRAYLGIQPYYGFQREAMPRCRSVRAGRWRRSGHGSRRRQPG